MEQLILARFYIFKPNRSFIALIAFTFKLALKTSVSGIGSKKVNFRFFLCFQDLTPKIPKTKFSCKGRPSGYYADVDTGCTVYHMCDESGRQFTNRCPNATLFQQRMLICDHWYMVKCESSEKDYKANLLIGK